MTLSRVEGAGGMDHPVEGLAVVRAKGGDERAVNLPEFMENSRPELVENSGPVLGHLPVTKVSKASSSRDFYLCSGYLDDFCDNDRPQSRSRDDGFLSQLRLRRRTCFSSILTHVLPLNVKAVDCTR